MRSSALMVAPITRASARIGSASSPGMPLARVTNRPERSDFGTAPRAPGARPPFGHRGCSVGRKNCSWLLAIHGRRPPARRTVCVRSFHMLLRGQIIPVLEAKDGPRHLRLKQKVWKDIGSISLGGHMALPDLEA